MWLRSVGRFNEAASQSEIQSGEGRSRIYYTLGRERAAETV